MPPCSFQQKHSGTDFKYRMIADVISFSVIISPHFLTGLTGNPHTFIYIHFSLYTYLILGFMQKKREKLVKPVKSKLQ